MTIRWRRILPVLLPVLVVAIAFSAYAYSRPDIYCVIVNEQQQTTIKAAGKRCRTLSPDEAAIIPTSEGAFSVGQK